MQRENLSQRTADTLRSMILEEKVYEFGQKLPNENELSEKLGISRTTLREAIRVLTSEGILTVKRGLGTFVSEQIDQIMTDASGIQDILTTRVTLRDLYEARAIFEPEAAALACKRATDEEIENILKLGDECEKQLKKNPMGADRINSEIKFHGAILQSSHNEVFSRFMPILSETIEKTISMNYNLEVIAEDAFKDHIMIMNFLKNRDAEALKSAVTIHLHHAVIHEQIPWSDR